MAKNKYSTAKLKLGVLGPVSGTASFLTITKSGAVRFSKDSLDIRKKPPRGK